MQYSFEYLNNEACSLLTRLNQVQPFSMTMPMVKGASVSAKAFKEIIELLENEKAALRKNIYRFIKQVKRQQKAKADEKQLQAAFAVLKLRFNDILDQLDIFADVLSQRGENDTGVWLAGLDVLAEDGMEAIKLLADIPALMVYLDRGHGAAIRRARTRLPGGDENPVAIIQVPRERLVGSGIASSLIHEVGHQVASLLNLVPSLSAVLARKVDEGRNAGAWQYFNRCISEIISDVWALGHLGVSATMGLMGVVTLPRYFQFRLDMNDPHPAPYLRVQISCWFGKRFYPHPQWDKLWLMWNSFYPREGLDKESLRIMNAIELELDAFIEILIHHSTKEMRGKKLMELFPIAERQPDKLKQLYQLWNKKKISLSAMPPTLVFAVMGQAKAELEIDASAESSVLTRQLRHWAFARN
ncbi:hypothetical protein [Mucilaginibacter agri]|uniref:Uncharacterized protein n=1 Tax=Mucilaginibacter agri TaxID=2695265 RepID=A0A965ZFI5_9SPHI|nr:hypothetical protein [Mucilaginibacter agri]NCD68721.1 hypothetical protein [Mucilaginibacter agri]